jgi:undecaprenyl-diphosphatase
MNDSGTGQALYDAGVAPRTLPTTSRLAAALSFLAVGASCIVLMQLDVPLLRFFRSLDLSSMQTLGDLGEKAGNGASLVAVSLGLLGIGWFMKRKDWIRAGVESLLAHGCVGLFVNGLKHLIGRPRPRLTHSGEWLWWPSWESGLDSFPSGHASSTFAVATVLARQWPRVGWVGYGVATWVAMSRVWRGSHFAGDVVAGMVAGVVVGAVFAAPLGEWRETLLRTIVQVTPIAVIATSLLWLVFRPVENILMDRMLSVLGLVLIGAGLLVRWRLASGVYSTSGTSAAYRVGVVSVAVGLAFTSGSLIPAVLAVLTASAWCLQARARDLSMITPAPPFGHGNRVVLRPFYVLSVLLVMVLIFKLKGIVPIR